MRYPTVQWPPRKTSRNRRQLPISAMGSYRVTAGYKSPCVGCTLTCRKGSRMGGLAPLLNGSLLLLGVAWGYGACRRLRARQAGITVDNVLQHAPALALPILGLLGWSVGVVAVQSCPALVWRLPLWFDFYRLHLVWGGVLLLFAFSSSLTVAVAFCTHHAKRWQLASVG